MRFDPENLDRARKYLEALEAGATGEENGRFFAPHVVQEELPRGGKIAAQRYDCFERC